MKIFALEILTTHPFQPLKKSSVLVEGGFPYPGRLGVYPDLHILKAGPYTRVYLPLTLSCPKTLFKRTTSDIISIRVVFDPSIWSFTWVGWTFWPALHCQLVVWPPSQQQSDSFHWATKTSLFLCKNCPLQSFRWKLIACQPGRPPSPCPPRRTPPPWEESFKTGTVNKFCETWGRWCGQSLQSFWSSATACLGWRAD